MTPSTHIHDRSLSWHGASTPIKSDWIKVVLWILTSPPSEMMRSCIRPTRVVMCPPPHTCGHASPYTHVRSCIPLHTRAVMHPPTRELSVYPNTYLGEQRCCNERVIISTHDMFIEIKYEHKITIQYCKTG